MNDGTATTAASMAPVSPGLVIKTMRELELLPRPPWVLVSPDGRVWANDNPVELLQVLMPYHPLLKPPGFGHG